MMVPGTWTDVLRSTTVTSAVLIPACATASGESTTSTSSAGSAAVGAAVAGASVASEGGAAVTGAAGVLLPNRRTRVAPTAPIAIKPIASNPLTRNRPDPLRPACASGDWIIL